MSQAALHKRDIVHRFALWALITVELLMSFSFLGYVHVEPISITTAYIPVLLAGALLGPADSAILGLVFGLASMWKASANYVMEADHLFSPLFSGYPLGSVMLSVGSRTLFGLAVGLLYDLAKKLRPSWLWVGLVSFVGKTIHSFMVYGAMALFFPEAGYGPSDAFSGMLEPSNVLSGLLVAAVILLFFGISRSKLWLSFRKRLTIRQGLYTEENYHSLSLISVVVLTLASAFSVTIYFVHRMEEVLNHNGIRLTDDGYTDMLHLQIQFLFGIISLMVLVILFLIVNRLYNSHMAMEGKLDPLTGLRTRKAFFSDCSQALRSLRSQEDTVGYFIMLDVDHFKDINDSYGHPEGDQALKEVSKVIRDSFAEDCIAARMGGDEFAILVCRSLPKAELQHFLDRIGRIPCGARSLSCSIGALRITEPALQPEELYLRADRLLYEAKSLGRGRYVIG